MHFLYIFIFLFIYFIFITFLFLFSIKLGSGTRRFVNDSEFMSAVFHFFKLSFILFYFLFPFFKKLKELCDKSELIFTVCTGAGLLAKTGLLEEKEYINFSSNYYIFFLVFYNHYLFYFIYLFIIVIRFSFLEQHRIK